MDEAIRLARKGAGAVSPNPLVGCVIVSRDGQVLGEGYHTRYGAPHAEVEALRDVERSGGDPSGGTAYVTLEPCSHHGKTPPCAPLLVESGLARVVVGMQDPNPAVDGRGLELLRNAGLQVDVGVRGPECEKLNEAWIHRTVTGLPFVTLKAAQTADGFIAEPSGASKWISCEASRTLTHRWRAEMDAVMVGRATALSDNPALTVRHVEGRQPRRIVLDGPLELPETLRLFSDSHEEKTTLVTWNEPLARERHDPMLKMLRSGYFRGDVMVVSRTADGHVDLREVLRNLAASGVCSLLVEGGTNLSSAMIRQNLADRLQLFIAPMLLGTGKRSFSDIGIATLEESGRYRAASWTPVGRDMLLTLDF